ncbi:hypothetical protein [Anatilimnocola aggregata]|nr:hypothetical protein [Anatilimnocola aggregata]
MNSTSNLTNELRDFHSFVGAQLAANRDQLTPEEIVELWRDQHPTDGETAATVAAVQSALADMAAGDTGISLAEHDRQFRAKHGLPPSA